MQVTYADDDLHAICEGAHTPPGLGNRFPSRVLLRRIRTIEAALAIDDLRALVSLGLAERTGSPSTVKVSENVRMQVDFNPGPPPTAFVRSLHTTSTGDTDGIR